MYRQIPAQHAQINLLLISESVSVSVLVWEIHSPFCAICFLFYRLNGRIVNTESNRIETNRNGTVGCVFNSSISIYCLFINIYLFIYLYKWIWTKQSARSIRTLVHQLTSYMAINNFSSLLVQWLPTCFPFKMDFI